MCSVPGNKRNQMKLTCNIPLLRRKIRRRSRTASRVSKNKCRSRSWNAELAVVTSVVERDVFESDAPSDPEWVVPRVLRHERVVETVLSRGPILPVRFGALFATRQALMAWVAANRAAISGFLDHVSDKEEWTVRIHVELGTALDILMAREPDWIARAACSPVVTRYSLFPGEKTACRRAAPCPANGARRDRTIQSRGSQARRGVSPLAPEI